MSRHHASTNPWLPVLLITSGILIGCGGSKQHEHDHDHDSPSKAEQGHGHDHDHDHGGSSTSGVSFKPGTGITLTEETQRVLDVEVVEVTQQRIQNQIQFTLQIFGEKHRHPFNAEDHSGCDVHGSALLPAQVAQLVKPGQLVQVLKVTNAIPNGVVLSLHPALALGEPEVIVGISNATQTLRPGEFVPARILIPPTQSVTAVPQSAVLPTSEGSFVYVANGNAYLRTAVKTGAESDGFVEIVDGLLDGDQVVSRPVQTLWLIELRATKGGGHSH